MTARDVADSKRAAERNERDHVRVSRLLELAQRSHELTEAEILDRTLLLARDLTRSAQGYFFLPVGDATSLELAARRGSEADRAADGADALARAAAARNGIGRMRGLAAPGDS